MRLDRLVLRRIRLRYFADLSGVRSRALLPLAAPAFLALSFQSFAAIRIQVDDFAHWITTYPPAAFRRTLGYCTLWPVRSESGFGFAAVT